MKRNRKPRRSLTRRSPSNASVTATAVNASALPHLSAFLSGYLHQDFFLDHPTPGAALRAFLDESSLAERRALQRDWSRFLEATHGWAWRDVRRAFADLGGAWLPASRAALAELFSAIN